MNPTCWLALWFEEVDPGTLSLWLILSPMQDQALRLRIVDRLTRDPKEFGLHRGDFRNNPAVPTQWVFLAGGPLLPIQAHGHSRHEARLIIDDAITALAMRFEGLGRALEEALGDQAAHKASP